MDRRQISWGGNVPRLGRERADFLLISFAQKNHVGDVVFADDGQGFSIRRPMEVGNFLSGEVGQLVSRRAVDGLDPEVICTVFADLVGQDVGIRYELGGRL
jgi:hypothetical protein